ncbi:MAG: proline--tRNA ligase [Gemmatales bacterium]|nr:proline--tRNA ligase [Gemmatales bacterium]MDW8175711.1 proline--tRNA ligase [Gemmatales bacterium]
MRWSQTFIPTLKEDPAEAQVPSHRLMVRAGLVRQLVAGAYTYLPLGFRALQKAIRIVREEMDRAGALEILMPAIHPAELWQQTGRFADYGDTLMKVRDRKGALLVLGPTHEEVITDLVRHHINSYRQLPVIFYQIQTKFRDEPRPRFGVLRTREFLMKDAYSFDVDVTHLNQSYDRMYQAYCRIFDRCGLKYVVVEAESGPIGGEASHEFMVLADTGEDALVECERCRYAANLERAEIGARSASVPGPSDSPLRKVHTPGRTTIEQVSAFLQCLPQQMIKTLIYLADGAPVAVLVRGDHEVNEHKLRRALGAARLELADADTIARVTAAPVGFAGPIGLPVKLYADRAVMLVTDGVSGANEADYHLVGVQPGRDFQPDWIGDLRIACDGDACPRCVGELRLRRGIEIGHVFKLGTKYSARLGAHYLDEKGQEHPMVMGCYGIGINRILAALIETSHDDQGIIWSVSLAPYQVLVLPLNVANAELMQTAERIYRELEQQGIEVLLDDRDARAGFKFHDADLLGLPLRVVIGEKALQRGEVELKWRHHRASFTVPVEQAARRAAEEIRRALERLM